MCTMYVRMRMRRPCKAHRTRAVPLLSRSGVLAHHAVEVVQRQDELVPRGGHCLELGMRHLPRMLHLRPERGYFLAQRSVLLR